MNKQTVLILEVHRQTLSVLRSLSNDYKCIIGLQNHSNINHERDQAFIEKSKFAKQKWRHPLFAEQSKFEKALIEYLNQTQVDFIFPVGEESLVCLNTFRDRIPTSTVICAPSADVVQLCLDKDKSLDLMDQLGIPSPKSEVLKDFNALPEVKSQLGLPLVLKPTSSDRQLEGEKALIFNSAEDFDHELTSLANLPFPLIAQRKALGLRHNCVFAARNGEVIQYFECKVLRTDKWNHTGYGVESVAIEPTAQHQKWTKEIARALSYTGVGCVQFLSENGSSNFLELNPRLDAIIELPRVCKIDFPKLTVQIANGMETSTTDRYPLKRCHWLLGDLRGLMIQTTQRKISIKQMLTWFTRLCLTTLKMPHHVTFSFQDPGPSIYLAAHLLRTILRKALG